METEKQREMLDLMTSLSREIRCCSRDEAFCEGVTFQQFVILDTVVLKQGIFLSDLHGILSVEKSTTTRLVNPLVKKGYLSREAAQHDSRAIKLVLTVQGREIHKRVWHCLADLFARVSDNIPTSQRKSVFESVRAFAGAIRVALDESSCCQSNSRVRKDG